MVSALRGTGTAESVCSGEFLCTGITGSDVNGADFPLTEMLKYKDHSHVLGLAEMMNFPAVIAGEAETLDKLDAFRDMTLDGHCPMVTGKISTAILRGLKTVTNRTVMRKGWKNWHWEWR